MNKEPEVRPRTKFIGTLPRGVWNMARCGEYIIFTNPEHVPRVLIDGELRYLNADHNL